MNQQEPAEAENITSEEMAIHHLEVQHGYQFDLVVGDGPKWAIIGRNGRMRGWADFVVAKNEAEMKILLETFTDGACQAEVTMFNYNIFFIVLDVPMTGFWAYIPTGNLPVLPFPLERVHIDDETGSAFYFKIPLAVLQQV